MKNQHSVKLTRRVTVNLTETEEMELNAYASVHQQKIAWVVRMAIKHFLDKENGGQKSLDLDRGDN